MRILKIAGGTILVGFVLLQFITVQRSNPPVTADFAGPEDIGTLLRTACYNCHSNETEWPWYSYVSPVSLLVAGDVAGARADLNFSDWGNLNGEDKADRLKRIVRRIEQNKMPPPPYKSMHSEARLTETQRQRLIGWAGEGMSGADDLAAAMERGAVDRVRQLVKKGRWHTLEGRSGDLFNGENLENWWALSDQWHVERGEIVCSTSDRIHFLISEYVVDEPFQLSYEVAALARANGDGKMVGIVDAAGNNVLVALDDDEPHTIQIDSGRKVIDATGIGGPWRRETYAKLPMEVGKWYDVVCTLDGKDFTVSSGSVQLSHPFEPQFPVFIWLEVQRTGARFMGLRIVKL